MKANIRFGSYLALLAPFSNQPLSLNLLLKPFELFYAGATARDLLVGHLLEHMMDTVDDETLIDCLDVAASAWELGFEPAGDFLDMGPTLMTRELLQAAVNPMLGRPRG